MRKLAKIPSGRSGSCSPIANEDPPLAPLIKAVHEGPRGGLPLTHRWRARPIGVMMGSATALNPFNGGGPTYKQARSLRSRNSAAACANP